MLTKLLLKPNLVSCEPRMEWRAPTLYNTEHISEQVYHQQKMTHPHHQMQDLSSFCDYPPPAFDSFLYYNA